MTDWAATTSALAAAAGLGFTGWQLLSLRKDREEERRLGIEGVAVSWHPRFRPNISDVDPGGQAVWHYIFRLDNPGRFPISDVQVTVTFQLPVERLEHGKIPGGVRHDLQLGHPVLRGGGHREWERALQMTFDDRNALKQTTARVEFRGVDGRKHTTHWPHPLRTA